MGLLTPPVRSLVVVGLVATGPRRKEETMKTTPKTPFNPLKLWRKSALQAKGTR